MKFLLIVLSILAVFSLRATPASAEGSWAIGPSEVQEYVESCWKSPSTFDMLHEIPSLTSKLKSNKKAVHKQVNLDGMRLQNISATDLKLIESLTQDLDASQPLWGDLYPRDSKMSGSGVLTISRSQIKGVEKKVKLKDLSQYNNGPVCENALCASQKMFGYEKGIYTLWSLLRYQLLIAPYADINGDPAGLKLETMMALETAISAFPPFLHKTLLQDKKFFRFLKGYSLALYGSERVIANAAGAIFDPIDDYNFYEQVGILIHELGHRASGFGLTDYKNWDFSAEWLTASSWRRTGPGKYERDPTSPGVSHYGKTNPAEDFAESILLYRLNPTKLKTLSPSRYLFIRNKIFKGVEYIDNLCGA
jgi:hypothetical protein